MTRNVMSTNPVCGEGKDPGQAGTRPYGRARYR